MGQHCMLSSPGSFALICGQLSQLGLVVSQGLSDTIFFGTCRLLEKSYLDRLSRARQMRKDTMQAVEISFNNYLHQRGFTGGMSINKVTQELQLEVRCAKYQMLMVL